MNTLQKNLISFFTNYEILGLDLSLKKFHYVITHGEIKLDKSRLYPTYIITCNSDKYELDFMFNGIKIVIVPALKKIYIVDLNEE